MPLIRWACDDPTRVAAAQHWLQIRDHFVREHRLNLSLAQSVPCRLSSAKSFASLPFELLLAYQQHRGASELGHVFRIANGLHDHIDALVVVGTETDCLPAKMLAEAGCDPYHNELSRAARGSKPRLYFVTESIDNDSLQSLLGRLRAGGNGDFPSERRWALIYLGDSQHAEPQTLQVAFDHLFDLQHRSDWQETPERPGLVTLVGDKPWLHCARFRNLGISQHLCSPPNLARTPMNALCPAGLLVAAFLGFDCVQLLVGAVAQLQHFTQATFTENPALQAAAFESECKQGGLITLPSQSLASIGLWMASAGPWWGHGRFCDHAVATAETVARWRKSKQTTHVCHITVDFSRTDPLPVEVGRTLKKKELAGSLPACSTDAHDAIRNSLSNTATKQCVVRLPTLEMPWLGQLIQMRLISAAVLAMHDASNGDAFEASRVQSR